VRHQKHGVVGLDEYPEVGALVDVVAVYCHLRLRCIEK
jgi:hypothetical protein